MNIFTLAIGNHFYGFAAFFNSLCAIGFDGQFHVGYQGEIRCQVATGAPRVRCRLELPKPVCSWLRNNRGGRAISKAKRLRARFTLS